MMYSVFLLVLLAGLAVARKDYDMDTFRDNIEDSCLSGLRSPPLNYREKLTSGLTMANFIEMVERVEKRNPDWSVYDVTRVLLRRFAFDSISYKDIPNRKPVQSDDAKMRWTLAKKLVGDPQNIIEFNEDSLNRDEKCTMFFMLGHTVNDTKLPDDEDASQNDGHLNSQSGGDGVLMAPAAKRAARPREQGVVSVHGSKDQAIALGMVLNGILASRQDNEVDARDLYSELTDSYKIRPLISLTLGEMLTRAVRRAGNNQGEEYFGPGGEWNHTLCPFEYRLRKDVGDITRGLLRGAVDGLLIGKALKDNEQGIQGTTLSRILRMYYSRKGLPKSAEPTQQGYSYCRRQEATEAMNQLGGSDSIKSYYKVFLLKNDEDIRNPDADAVINNAISQLNSALNSPNPNSVSQECQTAGSSNPSNDQPICETPSNVLVILDNSEKETEGFMEQENIVGMMANRLDFGEGGGTLSIFQSALSGNVLSQIAYNFTNPTCATCKATWLDQKQLSKPDSEFKLMEALNQTLGEFERKTDLLPGVPSKTVVFFHFDAMKDNKNLLIKAGNMLRDGHRDTRIIGVGKNKEGLIPIVSGTDNVLDNIEQYDNVAKDLVKKICQVPAVFQFNRCFDHSNNRKEQENVYTGYVTDNHVQFWAFYPEYFLKSFNIKIKFHVESGDILVCMQRGGADNPGYNNGVFDRTRCKKTEAGKRDLIFDFKDPCEGYDVNNCHPIRFSVIGDASNSKSNGCPANDDRCRRLDQIQFKVSHEGMFCSGCEFLKSSPVIIAMILVFSIFKLKE